MSSSDTLCSWILNSYTMSSLNTLRSWILDSMSSPNTLHSWILDSMSSPDSLHSLILDCHELTVMDILNCMLDIRISFYISSICHSVIYLIFLDSKSPFSNYKTFSSFTELNLPMKTWGFMSNTGSIMIERLVPWPYQIQYLVSV